MRIIIAIFASLLCVVDAQASIIQVGMRFHSPNGQVVGNGQFSYDTNPIPLFLMDYNELGAGSGSYYGIPCDEFFGSQSNYDPTCTQVASVRPIVNWQATINGVSVDGPTSRIFAEGQLDYHDPRNPWTYYSKGAWDWDNDPCWALGTCAPSQFFSMNFSFNFRQPGTFSFFYSPTFDPYDWESFLLVAGKVTFYRVPTNVPLPAAFWVFALGLGGVLSISRSRSVKSNP